MTRSARNISRLKTKAEAPKRTAGRVVEVQPPRRNDKKYRPEYVEQAKKLCALGATNPELADFFEVGLRTFERWRSQYKELSEAVNAACDACDTRVERSLYERATGYTFEAVKIFCNDGKVIQVPYRERVPPDTVAMIFWLKNRHPDRWRDVHRTAITDSKGNDYTDDQRARALAVFLARTGPPPLPVIEHDPAEKPGK